MGILSKNDGGYRESYGEMMQRLERDKEKNKKRRQAYKYKKDLKNQNKDAKSQTR